MAEFDFVRRDGEELTVEEIVGQAVGAGSVCWLGPIQGEFDSTRASQIVDKAVAELRRLGYPDDSQSIGDHSG